MAIYSFKRLIDDLFLKTISGCSLIAGNWNRGTEKGVVGVKGHFMFDEKRHDIYVNQRKMRR